MKGYEVPIETLELLGTWRLNRLLTRLVRASLRNRRRSRLSAALAAERQIVLVQRVLRERRAALYRSSSGAAE